ncbi:MAG: lipoate--protein ligase family protein [Solirubrobacterales bacterium]|nr:lipoate--protein ligase family protein [Solirubrobacterales bacterium]
MTERKRIEAERAARARQQAAAVAFGRLDARLPGFAEATGVARAHGFAPVLRLAGGQAAAFDQASLLVEDVSVTSHVADGLQERFADRAALLAGVLADLGLDARVGELPGEYCPGRHSVNVGGRLKVVGTAQRAVAGAALLTAVVVVGHGAAIRDVITAVYAALGRPVDPATAGAIDEVAPGVTVDAVRERVLAAYGQRAELREREPGAQLLAHAARLVDGHRP